MLVFLGPTKEDMRRDTRSRGRSLRDRASFFREIPRPTPALPVSFCISLLGYRALLSLISLRWLTGKRCFLTLVGGKPS